MSEEIDRKILGNRIRKLRQRKKIKIKNLAHMIGITPSALSMVEAGYRGVSIDVAKKLSSIFDVSIDYLLGNVDDPDPNLLSKILKPYKEAKEQIEKIQLRVIPVYDGAHAGDVGMFPDDLSPCEFIAIPQNSQGKYGVVVHGDSMAPVIEDGDIVVVDPEAEVPNGKRAVVFVDGGIMVKRVFYNDSMVILASDNQKYGPIMIKRSEAPVYILGKVVLITKKGD